MQENMSLKEFMLKEIDVIQGDLPPNYNKPIGKKC